MSQLFKVSLPLLLFIAVVAAAQLQGQGVEVGDQAPEFSLKGSDGKTYSLSHFRGKKGVVVAWFPKAFTRG